ncbi:MAG: tetratricopeptide repeat protein [Gemmatimonadota bacterium]|nr:tetratricopeptide repeat protein [Gemmatimonadota bacterium]
MPTPFLSSEEYDERAHQLYNDGQYDEALDVLRDGLSLYPNSVELHIGVGYARLAREEFAWARQSFEKSLVLDPDHEDALAGLGETLLKFGQRELATGTFHRVLDLGYNDDIDLMLQVGRALFREGLIEESRQYFETAVEEAPESAESVACLGYVQHRLLDDEAAIASLYRALEIDAEHTEARIYLANILYDRGDHATALVQLDQTTPDDHWDELGIWRLMELKKSISKLSEGDPELRPWEERLAELAGDPDDIDEMLAEIEQRAVDAAGRAPSEVKGQLELFGALLTDLADRREERKPPVAQHEIEMDQQRYEGSWEEIVRQMRDANSAFSGRSLQEFMATEARRGYSLTGVKIPTHTAESFIRASADAGLLRIVL